MFDLTWKNTQDSQDQLAKNLSAYAALDEAFISIAARIHLIRNATHRLDLQYYMWNKDHIGLMILHELLQAANRGVQINLLIDDQNGSQLDYILCGLAQHDLFQIRIFNPYKFRKLRWMDYFFRFKTINHRMHNKLIIADQETAVTGGRNISGEYFDASTEFQFTDMDIFFHGHAVSQANTIFNNFWVSSRSIAIEKLVDPTKAQPLNELEDYFKDLHHQQKPTEDKILLAQQQFEQLLENYSINWAKASCIADQPEKVNPQPDQSNFLYQQMLNISGVPKKQLDLVSAYFIPGKIGAKFLANVASCGITTRILTNSFAANDVAIVHAFYKRYRKYLLKNGVQLYEFKPEIERHKKTWFEVITGRMIPYKGRSRSSLHAKLFVIDKQVFIGSFNFDPRSAYLNTEVGLVVQSDHLQQFINHHLEQFLPLVAYQLSLDAKGKIIWSEQLKNGETKVYTTDPNTNLFQRTLMIIISLLPIEWML